MDIFKISTVTEQFPNQLAQGQAGKVILAGEGDPWILENLITTEGGDNRAIVAPRLGMLQALASLAPVFKPGCDELSGEVRLSLGDDNDRFPWRFEGDGGNGFTITAREQSIPDGVVLPQGGKVFLVWEGTEVKWVFSGGVVPAVPRNALWRLEKIDQVQDTLKQVKISLSTQEFVLPTKRFLSQEDGGVTLTTKGDSWFLRPASTGGDTGKDAPPPPSANNVNAILAPSLGSLNVLAQLAPIFPPAEEPPQPQPQPPSACHGAAEGVEKRGEVGLSVATAGDEYQWAFVQRPDGLTISGRAPAGQGFPAGGRVYLVWDLMPNVVKWQFAGGIVEEIPPRATWAVAPLGDPASGGCGEDKEKEHEGATAGAERAPVASVPPAV